MERTTYTTAIAGSLVDSVRVVLERAIEGEAARFLSAGAVRAIMPADLRTKTDRYERLLAEALEEAAIDVREGSPLYAAAIEYREMATSYLEDGRHFREDDDPVNALAAFSYGHAWLDAGARLGIFDVPEEDHLFTI